MSALHISGIHYHQTSVTSSLFPISNHVFINISSTPIRKNAHNCPIHSYLSYPLPCLCVILCVFFLILLSTAILPMRFALRFIFIFIFSFAVAIYFALYFLIYFSILLCVITQYCNTLLFCNFLTTCNNTLTNYI